VIAEFWNWVERERLKRGWTERKLAVKAGLDASTIFQGRKRGSQPTHKVVRALAQAFELPQTEVLRRIGYFESKFDSALPGVDTGQ
jgi:transcriptional regulator with XRE-family HTH domain